MGPLGRRATAGREDTYLIWISTPGEFCVNPVLGPLCLSLCPVSFVGPLFAAIPSGERTGGGAGCLSVLVWFVCRSCRLSVGPVLSCLSGPVLFALSRVVRHSLHFLSVWGLSS